MILVLEDITTSDDRHLGQKRARGGQVDYLVRKRPNGAIDVSVIYERIGLARGRKVVRPIKPNSETFRAVLKFFSIKEKIRA